MKDSLPLSPSRSEASSVLQPEAHKDVVAADLAEIRERLADEFEVMAGSRLLITGGAGFLGYYLVQAVTEFNRSQAPGRRIEPTVIDRFERGMPSWLAVCAEAGELTALSHDVTQPLDTVAGAEAGWEWIVHAASIASPIFYRQHPIATMDANVLGLRRLLDFCRDRQAADRPIEGFLFFSSSEIYGDASPEWIPTPESYWGNVSSIGPRACYDESKRFGETLCVNFHRQYGLPVRIVRPFNNYGPGLKATDGRLLSDFIRSAVAGEDIIMYSDGSPTRTFCYITDAVVGYFRILVRGRSGEAYNIGSDRPEISVGDVADRVVTAANELLEARLRVIAGVHADADYLTDNPQRRCPDITKARSELGFEPRVGLDDGLRRMLLWYRQRPEEASV